MGNCSKIAASRTSKASVGPEFCHPISSDNEQKTSASKIIHVEKKNRSGICDCDGVFRGEDML